MSGKRIKAISLWQPYATLIACGFKRVETRSWRPSERELQPGDLVAIHASKHWTAEERMLCSAEWPDGDPIFQRFLGYAAHRGLWDTQKPPLGVVVAVARFHRAVPTERLIDNPKLTPHEMAFGNFAPGRWGWVFSEVWPVTPPIALRGERGIFTWADAPDEVLSPQRKEDGGDDRQWW